MDRLLLNDRLFLDGMVGITADDVDINVARLPDQVIDKRSTHQLSPLGHPGLAHHDLGDVVMLRIVDNCFGEVGSVRRFDGGAQFLCQSKIVFQTLLISGRQDLSPFQFDM